MFGFTNKYSQYDIDCLKKQIQSKDDLIEIYYNAMINHIKQAEELNELKKEYALLKCLIPAEREIRLEKCKMMFEDGVKKYKETIKKRGRSKKK
jgi:hypothetical protein